VKVLVVIGDACPHQFGDVMEKTITQFGQPQNLSLLNIDWKQETANLKQRDITVFSCHAMPDTNEESIPFYTYIAEETGGLYFPLNELQAFKEYMVGICMRAADGADDIQMLRERSKELVAKLQHEKDELQRQKLAKESEAVHSAIRTSKSEGLFSPGFASKASVFRSSLKTRTECYEEELKATKPAFFSHSSNNIFVDVLRNRPGFETARKTATESLRKSGEQPDDNSPTKTLSSRLRSIDINEAPISRLVAPNPPPRKMFARARSPTISSSVKRKILFDDDIEDFGPSSFPVDVDPIDDFPSILDDDDLEGISQGTEVDFGLATPVRNNPSPPNVPSPPKKFSPNKAQYSLSLVPK